jgi:hypothetical protein
MKNKIAKSPVTGLYYNGRAFESPRSEAMILSPGVTAETFRLSWACPVEIEEIEGGPATTQITSCNRHKTSSGRIYYIVRRSDSRAFSVTQYSRDGWAAECSKTFETRSATSLKAAKKTIIEW